MKPPSIPELLLMRLGIPDDASRIVRWYATELRERPRQTLRNFVTDVSDVIRERLQ